MKIALLGHEDLASFYALNRLIGALPEHEFDAYVSVPMETGADMPPELAGLDALDRRLLDEYLRRGDIAESLRKARALPAPNSAEGLSMLRDSAADLIVSIRYRRILKDEVIAIPAHGVLNLHSGILPDYRGVMATFWAMLNGEAEIGTTLHRIVDAGIDTGPIIAVTRRRVDYGRSYLHNVLALYDEGCRRTSEAVRAIARGNGVEAELQSAIEGAYFSTPDRASLALFFSNNLILAADNDLESLLGRP